ncbi:GAF domain-containing protein [Candidatus Sumerlaeota bacterium]|nr:GAF domain-containing protein [Candidatus Sumerlaeota bacterium]
MIPKEVQIEIPEATLEAWQEIVDILADIMGIPAGLIMQVREPHIEVLVASHSEGNPYHPGDSEEFFGSGLYCERVIRTRDRLLVPNALVDEEWRENPDIKLDMISYLGFPILLPDGKPFGTICVLDNRENAYSDKFEKLMVKFRNLLQADLAIIYMNQVLGDRNRRLTDYMAELQALRGLVPICAHCKSIRDERGEWHPIEHYLIQHPEAEFSHGICPRCIERHFPDFEEEP